MGKKKGDMKGKDCTQIIHLKKKAESLSKYLREVMYASSRNRSETKRGEGWFSRKKWGEGLRLRQLLRVKEK